MSRTLRKIITVYINGDQFVNPYVAVVDDTAAKHRDCKSGNPYKQHRLKPYAKPRTFYNSEKYYRAEHNTWVYPNAFHTYMGNTRQSTKLEVNNANRSLKKGIRRYKACNRSI